MGYRRKAREIALQILYQVDVSRINVQKAVELYWTNFDVPENVKIFSTMLIMGTWEHLDEIDTFIKKCSEHWTLDRMAKVDKSIIRMATYELLYCNDIPPKVTLNEAIDLGKSYGSENSGSFVNGILDALYTDLQDKIGDKSII